MLLAAALAWFAGLEYRGLFMPDEGRYAEIAREMLDSGDWVTPRLNGLKYFEKPPLQYWATAAAYALLGVDEWTARLWPAVTGVLGIAYTVFAAARLAPGFAWLPLALALAGCWGFFVGGQFLTLDMGLTFFLNASVLSFLLGRRSGISVREAFGWTMLAWAAAGCAVLSKGVVGILLPALALIAYAVVERDWSVIRRLRWTPGLLLFGAITIPWFVLVQIRNPEFFRFFFIHEHFERYLLPAHHRPGPWWYFLPVLIIGLLPFTAAVPAAIARGWRRRSESGFNVDRFLIMWSAIVVVFFSASHSKLPGYVLPALPAILLLFARAYPAMSDRLRRAPASTCAVLGVTSIVAAAALHTLSVRFAWTEYDPNYALWFVAAGVTLSATGLAALRLFSAREELSLAVLGLGSLIALQLAISGTHLLDGPYSSERLIQSITGEHGRFPRDPPFYSVLMFDQSVPFYLGRPVTLVGVEDELAPGIAAEPEKYVVSVEDFLRRWNEHREAYAIMTPGSFEKLERRGLAARVIASDARHIVVAKPQREPGTSSSG